MRLKTVQAFLVDLPQKHARQHSPATWGRVGRDFFKVGGDPDEESQFIMVEAGRVHVLAANIAEVSAAFPAAIKIERIGLGVEVTGAEVKR